MAKRAPTRRDLLVIVGRLQGHISTAYMCSMDESLDPGPIRKALDAGLTLCIDALQQDPPCDNTRGPWGTASERPAKGVA